MSDQWPEDAPARSAAYRAGDAQLTAWRLNPGDRVKAWTGVPFVEGTVAGATGAVLIIEVTVATGRAVARLPWSRIDRVDVQTGPEHPALT